MWNADDQCRILLRDRHAYMHYTSAASLEVFIYRFLFNENELVQSLDAQFDQLVLCQSVLIQLGFH